MKTLKVINNDRLRFWIYDRSCGWGIHRKSGKPLGYIFFLGRVRISCTIIKPRMVLFNPYTLQRIPL